MADGRPQILIIDDEKITSHTMAMALDAVGYHTSIADSGETGLRQALETHPQLIMLDYNMPGMDGIAVLKALRQDIWGKEVPVIVASNVYDIDIINVIIENGVQDYVLKVDVNLDEIIKLVSKYIPAPSHINGQPGQ